ncbi:MAG: hypothetical protein A2275_17755 [Bacteroidetes bacterium RIFOXYA12_FULL_35_11]|nr:MAG: hypothetical protein A2X01_14620 [Bacteroidetes bacterium GWF2_35_48]OFY80585.1 MAG: hypothetical protein A2275_17755 [Bacteroidetes bacterium RIFOXYA12_FULL_35_11]OFY93735.1 MAG: hypothetical protein A2309_02585 [Bacteroidetes bacterium RIFOXYB2_FULL_35_7]HBX50038.1 hypothetical protein [Bacteroidales bacterium]
MKKMKKNIIKSVFLIFIFLFSIEENKAQFHFNVSPGLQFNTANFGYKVNNFVPYFGLQILNGSANLSEKGERYDPDRGGIVPYEDKYKFSGIIYIPTLGTKYFFKETNKLKLYGTISFTKFILSGKIEVSNDSDANDELQSEIKKMNLWGGQLGFGTEYFFDNNFSVGGEFGLRLLRLKYKDTEEDLIYNPQTGNYVPSTTTNDYRFNLSPTYVRISFNYYFDK